MLTASRLVVFGGGLLFVLSGLSLLLIPAFFYAQVGHYPPFNRHYAGDAGAFSLPIGAGLLMAARDLRRFSALVCVGAAASSIHALNHLVGSLTGEGAWPQTIALLVQAGLVATAAVLAPSSPAGSRIPG